jgi:hypothetical protein
MRLIVSTQVEENYAAHNEGFVAGESKDHWKFKSGSDYVVAHLSYNEVANMAAGDLQKLAFSLASHALIAGEIAIEQDGPAFREYVIGWDIVDGLTEHETFQVEMDGKLKYPATDTTADDHRVSPIEWDRGTLNSFWKEAA